MGIRTCWLRVTCCGWSRRGTQPLYIGGVKVSQTGSNLIKVEERFQVEGGWVQAGKPSSARTGALVAGEDAAAGLRHSRSPLI